MYKISLELVEEFTKTCNGKCSYQFQYSRNKREITSMPFTSFDEANNALVALDDTVGFGNIEWSRIIATVELDGYFVAKFYNVVNEPIVKPKRKPKAVKKKD